MSGRPGQADSWQLDRRTVHVWAVELDRFGGEEAAAWLADDERRRAERFRLEPRRRQFIITRYVLRGLLGRYLGVPGRHIRFGYRRWGKPEIVLPTGTALRFNVAHSGDRALIAVGAGREVGVDIEYLRPRDIEGVAMKLLSPAEFAHICELPQAERPLACYQAWTIREAYFKARGIGLRRGLASAIEATGSGPFEWRAPDRYGRIRNWLSGALDIWTSHACALCTIGQSDRVQVFEAAHTSFSASALTIA